MKRKILGVIIAVVLLGVALSQAIPAMASTARPIDSTTATTASATMAPGARCQFTVQGSDNNDAERPLRMRVLGFDIRNMGGMFCFLNDTEFSSFLGGQWQVKNGDNTDTYKVIPGVVNTISETSLTIVPNDPTANNTFTITNTTIRPQNTTLAKDDKVIVITVNDQATMVIKIATNISNQMPPGLNKHSNPREGKNTPPGWFHGEKMGWGEQPSDN